MITRVVNLASANAVGDLVNMVSKYPFEVDIGSGNSRIDAKSVMGVFNMDLSKPVEISINASEGECSMLLSELERFS